MKTGCTGPNLVDPDQPIFVIGGLSVSDEKWRRTTDAVNAAVSKFFDGAVPKNFELHAHELVSCGGPFTGRARDECNAFSHRLLDIVCELKHQVHFVAIDKAKLAEHAAGDEHEVIDCRAPYLLGFNYLVSAIEVYVRTTLGRSATAMIILDEKELYQRGIDDLTRYRRYGVPATRRIKRIVEFSYPVDLKHHPLVQLSDVLIYLTKKFLECENGYRNTYKPAARNFFASCYDKICRRLPRTGLMDVQGNEEVDAHEF